MFKKDRCSKPCLKRQQGVAAAVAQKPRAASAHHCDTIYPASLGVTRRGSASKGKCIAAACAVEKERDAARRPAPKRVQSKKGKLEKKMALLAGAACMRCASVFFASNSLSQSPAPVHLREAARARCGRWAKHHVSHKVCLRRGRYAKHHVAHILAAGTHARTGDCNC